MKPSLSRKGKMSTAWFFFLLKIPQTHNFTKPHSDSETETETERQREIERMNPENHSQGGHFPRLGRFLRMAAFTLQRLSHEMKKAL